MLSVLSDGLDQPGPYTSQHPKRGQSAAPTLARASVLSIDRPTLRSPA